MMEKWYSIPGFSSYAITKSGKVKTIATDKTHIGSLCGSGYWNYHLKKDVGSPIVIGVHRLLAMTFIPNDDPKKDIVNHKDGNKLNNELDNLEWCTQLENIIHSAKFGLSKKCFAITIRNPVTNEVKVFHSIRGAGEYVGISKDAMRYRYWKFNGKVFPEGWQYMKGEHTGEWETPLDIEAEKREMADHMARPKTVLIRNLLTGDVEKFDTISEAAKIINMRRFTLSCKLRALDCPVFPPGLQFKFDDGIPWREPDNLLVEYKNSLNMVAVIVENSNTGEQTIFNSTKEVMKAMNITRATLFGRLKYGKKKTVDGYYYYHQLKSGPSIE